MSYIREKLGNSDKENVKSSLLSEGFEVIRDNYPDELKYFSYGSKLTAIVTVDIVEKNLHYYLDCRHGVGTVGEETATYTYENFEETYKNFIDELSERLR